MKCARKIRAAPAEREALLQAFGLFDSLSIELQPIDLAQALFEVEAVRPVDLLVQLEDPLAKQITQQLGFLCRDIHEHDDALPPHFGSCLKPALAFRLPV